MKFSNVLFFASVALAAPTSQEKRQGVTVAGTLLDTVNTLATTTQSNLAQINSVVASIKDNVGGSVAVEVQAQLRSNLQAVATALQAATSAIVTATTGALAGTGGQALALTNQELQAIITATQTAQQIVGNITATLTVTATDLRPAVSTLFVTEINNIRNAISPFITPLLTFVNTVRNASASASVVVTGLGNLLQQVVPLVRASFLTLGLSVLGLPAV
ncbi:hypothetical protein AK830_g9021 [Neonectria ditissima]|uniref:Uncharacterized protein n=1 Tax=Neonectria ditissima TaxID=78410 RepID=A0A0N8H5Z6_9HYPO|nr:hypothetical protein AK830_g9021 [Neonectria ditissima]